MIYSCERIGDSIVIFGLARPFLPYSPKREDDMRRQGLSHYCCARDQYGNVYDVYTEYDPCLTASRTVALHVEEV